MANEQSKRHSHLLTVIFEREFVREMNRAIEDTLLLKGQSKKGAMKFWLQKSIVSYMEHCRQLDLNTRQDMKAEYLAYRTKSFTHARKGKKKKEG